MYDAGSSAPKKTLRVLLIAEMCNPTWTSVPLVGYNFARALAQRDDLSIHLVTHIRNQEGIEQIPIPKLNRLTYIDNEFITRPMHQVSKWLRGSKKPAWTIATASQWPGYMLFERQIHRQFFRELEEGAFDIIHRLTPLSPTIPSPLARKTRIPMIIGPLNGGLPWPKQYPELVNREGEWLVNARFLHKLLPFYRSSYARLAGVIAGSKHTNTELSASFRGLRFYLPENGVDLELFPPRRTEKVANSRFRFVTVGRLVPYKGFDLIMEAMAGCEELKDSELVIIGEGPEKESLQNLIATKGLQDRVRLLGFLSQDKIHKEFESSDAFVFPSLREFGGAVVLEAMAVGLPSIIVDYGGPAELLDSESGILLPMVERAPLVEKLRDAMVRLKSDPKLCAKMSQAAMRRIQDHFTWSAKAEQITQFYQQTIEDSHHRGI